MFDGSHVRYMCTYPGTSHPGIRCPRVLTTPWFGPPAASILQFHSSTLVAGITITTTVFEMDRF